MIVAEIIVDTRSRSKKGYPLKIRVYCTVQKKHRYVALKKYQSVKKLKVDNQVRNRYALLQKEVEYCNNGLFGLEKSIGIIKSGLPKKKTMALEGFIESAIIDKMNRGMAIQALSAIKREFHNFGASDTDIRDVDYNFVKRFITYKKKSGTGDGGVSYYIRTASTLFNEAVRMGIVDNNPFKGHGIKRKRTTVLTLPSFEDIAKLVDYIPMVGTYSARDNMKRASELFLFQIHIGGHYLSDVSHLKVTDRVRFQRWKNRSHEGGGELVDNMISDYAMAFLETHGLDWIPNIKENKVRYNNFRRNYGATLKRISKHLGIEPKLEGSMPRYIFRSAGGECGANKFAIEQLQGHRPEGITYGYQTKFPYHILDAEHRKILDYIFRSRSL